MFHAISPSLPLSLSTCIVSATLTPYFEQTNKANKHAHHAYHDPIITVELLAVVLCVCAACCLMTLVIAIYAFGYTFLIP